MTPADHRAAIAGALNDHDMPTTRRLIAAMADTWPTEATAVAVALGFEVAT